jgi:hypothetical protein
MLEPQSHEIEEHRRVVAELRRRYPQYEEHGLENRPIIKVSIDRVIAWGAVQASRPAAT